MSILDVEPLFQPTPPSREATPNRDEINTLHLEFQPTPPSREATHINWMLFLDIWNFNPHLPRGRRQQLFTILPDIFIQNHYFIPLLSAKSLLLLIP